MGTYLHTHLITSFSAHIDPKDNADINDTALSIVDNPELFIVEENKGFYNWTLKAGILSRHLYNLLKIYYDDFYSDNQDYFKQNCLPVLDFLKTQPTEKEIWNYLENDLSDVFNICECSYFGADTIRLSYEGKVFYEEIDDHLNFFNVIIRKAYHANPLGSCLIIDIA